MTITSQRSFRHFFLPIFFFELFFLILGPLTWGIRDQAFSDIGYMVMTLMSAALFVGVVYVPYRYYKNVPALTINEESIIFGNVTFPWKEVEKVEMTGKHPFKFMWEQKEGMLLKFNGEPERYIFDDMYENISEIKCFIEAVAIGKNTTDMEIAQNTVEQSIPKVPGAAILNNSIASPVNHPTSNFTENNPVPDQEILGGEKYYKGFPLFSMEGITAWGLIAFFCTLGIMEYLKHYYGSSLLMCPAACVLLYFLFGNRMHYFGISNDTLIVKNYHFFWAREEYINLTDIKVVVFEQRGRLPITLRVIDNYFISTKYPAATLWGKTWAQLQGDLEKRGVKVRDECVFYEPFEFKLFDDD